MTKTTKKQSTSPYRKQFGRLTVSVFENVGDDGTIFFSTYLQRRYKAESGDWKDGPLSEEDLDDLLKARELALEYIAERKTRYSKSQVAAA